MITETENEQMILIAAENEFLDKGYNGAKTVTIAQKAGVTHAMLHYYFRTKENLFGMVFRKKVQQIADSFESVLDDDLSFDDNIAQFIHAHFKFIKANPRLVNFVYNEVYLNKANRDLFYKSVFPIISRVFIRITKMVNVEVEKGTIRPIDPTQLIINILSLNIITFIVYPLIREYAPIQMNADYEQILQEREDGNVEFVLQSLKKKD
jgi:TetR/AcrR family transcriptional regulator